MKNKCILPSIGLEGSKEELLEFISDFDFNKVGISFSKGKMIISTIVPVSDELMDLYEKMYNLK